MTVPFQRSESANLHVELCPNKCQSICNSITFFMELLRAKTIFTRSVYQFGLFDVFVAKKSFDGEFFMRFTNDIRKFEELSLICDILW